ncbi:response regulator [Mucilaginibacter pedocola]|uniref:Response regulatory domain-containing protein n=1 Tax=Mucilaginibacter pedocola TaxID=1792845 RepID=A0A1S9PFS7_9SPHI|nr:response regulator [Mucilaginibacter pedocola]OOQ59802.1 hypothetical protein BC343_06550 [Mucilaginibacter pedocola]
MAQQTIMVIDDDQEILTLINLILRDAGYLVKIGKDVTDLFEVEKNPPDLLLIDNWLDGKMGRDICYQLKTSPKTQHLKVLLISATHNLPQTAEAAKADGYVAKPFDVDVLLNAVKNALSAA